MPEPTREELDGLIDDVRRAFDGDAWHGPSLRRVLDGLTAEQADARPVAGGHTIREIVVHVAAWDDVVARRVAERAEIELPDGGNFPPGPATWAEALRELDARHASLMGVLGSLEPARLSEAVAGKDYSIAHMLRGIAQHHAYHAGQVALIKKLAAGRPARVATPPGREKEDFEA